jgi:hypothetical protein
VSEHFIVAVSYHKRVGVVADHPEMPTTVNAATIATCGAPPKIASSAPATRATCIVVAA